MKQQNQSMDTTMALALQSLAQLKRHRYAVILATVFLSIAGIVIVALLPNVYLATTTVLVDPQKIPERYVTSTVTSDPNARLNALTQLVLSATKLQEIIDRANLYPELRHRMSREELLDYVRSKIKIEVKSGSEQGLGSFTISYQDTNRFMVAPMANQLAESFITWNLQVRQQQALGTSRFLSSELDQAKKSLEEQENQLKTFREQHAGETPDDLSGNLQALSTLQSQLQANLDAGSRLDEERILLSQVKSPEARALGPSGERIRLLQEKASLENQLSRLKQQYTDTYPDVVSAQAQLKALDVQMAALPKAPSTNVAPVYDSGTRVRLDLIDRELHQNKQQQAALHHAMAAYQSKVEAVPALQMQLSELTRNYEVSRQNYQSLLDKSFSAGMAQDLESQQEAERFTALDTAKTPEKPFKPKRIPLMAVAVLISMLLSSGVTIGLGFLKRTIGSEAELEHLMPSKIEVLGTIPPIVSVADARRNRVAALGTAVVSLASFMALALFLMKVRPIL